RMVRMGFSLRMKAVVQWTFHRWACKRDGREWPVDKLNFARRRQGRLSAAVRRRADRFALRSRMLHGGRPRRTARKAIPALALISRNQPYLRAIRDGRQIAD